MSSIEKGQVKEGVRGNICRSRHLSPLPVTLDPVAVTLVLADRHDHLAFASAVKLAKKNSLPTSQQQFSVFEWNRDG